MPATSTITVSCPECGQPATITLTTAGPDELEQVLEFFCNAGHQLDEWDALRLWVSLHERVGEPPERQLR